PHSDLLMLHIRCWDYIGHCMHIANWSSYFMGFNEFPGLPRPVFPARRESRDLGRQCTARGTCTAPHTPFP
ncbi:hypothetical protein V8E53_007758, partial [Lactarius tabidus]